MTDFRLYQQAVSPALVDLISGALLHVRMSRDPNQRIERNGNAYINRWMLARKGQVPLYDDPAELLGYAGMIPSELENLYMHEYARSDADDPHCHPWPNVTLVVDGWYRENMYEAGTNVLVGTATRLPGDVVVRSSGSVHAIVETSSDCVSLFATLPKEKDWGFHTDAGFVHSRDYSPNNVRPLS